MDLRNIKSEQSYLSSRTDPEGILLISRLNRYWDFTSPSTNRHTYNDMASFFLVLKNRGEPITGWSVWAALAFFRKRRPELLELYDDRVANATKLADKTAVRPVGKPHFKTFMAALRGNSYELPA